MAVRIVLLLMQRLFLLHAWLLESLTATGEPTTNSTGCQLGPRALQSEQPYLVAIRPLTTAESASIFATAASRSTAESKAASRQSARGSTLSTRNRGRNSSTAAAWHASTSTSTSS